MEPADLPTPQRTWNGWCREGKEPEKVSFERTGGRKYGLWRVEKRMETEEVHCCEQEPLANISGVQGGPKSKPLSNDQKIVLNRIKSCK